MIGRGLEAWVRFVEVRTAPVFAAITLLVLVAGWVSATFSRIDSDLGGLIRPSDETAWYQYDQAYKSAFPALQQTAVVVVSGESFRDVETVTERLAAALPLRDNLETVFAPMVSSFVQDRRLLFVADDDLEDWLQGVQLNYGIALRLAENASVSNAVVIFADQVTASRSRPLPGAIESLGRGLASDPPRIEFELYPRLAPTGDDLHYQLIVVKGRQRLDERLPNEAIVATINDTIESIGVPGDVDVRLTGEVALANEEVSAALNGIAIAGLVSLVLLAIILGIGIRSLAAIATIFLTLVAGVVLTMGFATLAVGSYNTLSLIFIVMFFGLGVDFAVHFLLRLYEASETEADPLAAAARDIGPAIALCMLTSMIAFLSFTPTAYRGLAELGIISAGGMAIAFMLTLTLIPALFRRFGVPARMQSARPAAFDRTLSPAIVVTVIVVLALGAALPASKLEFDYSVLAMRDATTEGMETLLELQSQGIATDYSISILAAGAEEAEALKRRFESLPEIGTVSLPADYIPEGQVRKAGMMADVKALFDEIDTIEPASGDLAIDMATTYLADTPNTLLGEDAALYDALLASVRDLDRKRLAALNHDLREALARELGDLRRLLSVEPFSLDDIPEPFRERLLTEDGRHLVTVQPRDVIASREATERFIEAVSSVAPNFAGRSVVEWGVGEVVVDSFLLAVTISATVVIALLLVYFRDFLLALMVLVPIALSILFTFALIELTPLTLNMANILVVPLIIGLGVDTGIHVVHRYSTAQSVSAVYASSTARAVLISGLTTIGTFFSLSFSPHKGAASVGLLLTIAVSILLIVTFLVLPALLRLAGRAKH